jgi:hypothetical protein
MKTKLEKDGWKQVGFYGDCVIYAKGNDRLLYNLNKNKVEFEYKI